MAMMALIMLLLSPDPPTHLARKNNRSCKLEHDAERKGWREKEGGALRQVELSRHKESSSLFLLTLFPLLCCVYNNTAELQSPRLRSRRWYLEAHVPSPCFGRIFCPLDNFQGSTYLLL